MQYFELICSLVTSISLTIVWVCIARMAWSDLRKRFSVRDVLLYAYISLTGCLGRLLNRLKRSVASSSEPITTESRYTRMTRTSRRHSRCGEI